MPVSLLEEKSQYNEINTYKATSTDYFEEEIENKLHQSKEFFEASEVSDESDGYYSEQNNVPILIVRDKNEEKSENNFQIS